METHVEELPLEIWLIVFQYLEAHDLFQAFRNLNSHFNRILDSNQLSLYIRLKETDNNHLQNPNNPYWSNSLLNRITCLRPVVTSRSNYFLEFLRFHADKLIRLQSLSIKTLQQDIASISYLSLSLNELNRLEYVSLTCRIDRVIFDAILALPTLRICQLILKESPLLLDHFHLADVNSSIKQLFLVFLDRINYSLVNLLLCHIPKLKRLEISGCSFSFSPVSLFSGTLFTLPEVRVLKLKLEGGDFNSDCFQSLHRIFPALKYFYFHYTKHILPAMFLDHFITYWWSIIEPIQRFDIHLKGHIFIDDVFPIEQINFEKNRQILSEMINQSNEYIKFEWNEQNINKFKLIEINIIKN